MIRTPLIDSNTIECVTPEVRYSESNPKIYALFVKDFTDNIKMKFSDVDRISGIFTDKIKAIETAKNYNLKEDQHKKFLCVIMEYEEGNLDKSIFVIPNNEKYEEDSKRLVAIFLNGSKIEDKALYTEYLTETLETRPNKRYHSLSCNIM